MTSSPYSTQLVGAVVLAMTLIVGGDAAATVLTGAGFPQTFVAWTRFALAACLLAPLCGLGRADLGLFRDWRLYLRAGLIVGGIVSILTALKTEPMANVFAGFFVGPVVSYFLSATLLGERITPLRTCLLMTSFAGVLLVVRPGFGMTTGMGFAILAGCFHGSYLVATRWLAGEFRPRFLLFSQLIIGAVLLSPFALAEVPAVTLPLFGLITISALGSAGGNLLLVLVNRTTPAGVVAPLIYSQLLAAMIIGWAVFGQWPDGLSLMGLIIIIVAGVSSVWFAGKGR
ncbi:threonine/homoserine efflux transporter RhtA [Yoonia maricola]|uniref:Threonine/homoserine efflux transporter RhtA n=1 Tax=Yoonia maricola TaxID=420999 RepID=A0A2M8W5E9_9RHOB|nr:DMT family transporter [Yoonia maricola]PJI86151.1 threonine/homoserine efflux transporter RhtA [Yoonia maricola]